MSATHTPGPWHTAGCAVYAQNIKRCFGGPVREYVQPVAISEAEDSEESFDDSAWPKVRTPGFAEAEANARLIAAAPELLAALENIVGLWVDSEQNNGLAQIMARDAQTAIARAKATA